MYNIDRLSDRRQRVNLSDEAYNTIMSDRFTFASDKVISYSKIICRVFMMFVERSAVRRNPTKIEDLLRKKPSQAQTKTPSLRNEVLEYLLLPDIYNILNNKPFNGSPGQFIKCVVEEYAELPFIERERIYFGDVYNTITENINKLLRVTTGCVTLLVKPYQIMTDKQSVYNYLVGYASTFKSPEVFKATSLRLSRIKSLIVEHNEPTNLDFFEIEYLRKCILEKDVPYIKNQMCDLSVELSEKGKNLFNTIVFQRPKVVSINGNVYTFYCTETQAEFYFFKFGPEAKILKPVNLIKTFAERYAQAAKVYE